MKKLEQKSIVGKCNCGDPNCLDIMFQYHVNGETRGLGYTFLDDGRMLIIHGHPEKNKISELEII